MAYWLDPLAKCVGNLKEFYCDETSDIADMPTTSTEGTPQSDDSTIHHTVAKGSSVYCIGDSSIYILNSQDIWKQQ